MSFLVGCEANLTEQDEVFSDAAQRVKENLLPPLVTESEVVLRNLVNLLTALPEVCSTPLANLGSFSSSLPALGRPAVITLNDEDGIWEMVWRNVVFGDDDAQLTVDTGTPSVDVTLTVQFLTRAQQRLRAVPFTLTPQTTVQVAGEPASFACAPTETMGCFFLFQDSTPGPTAGQWTLRWRAVGDARVFEGRVNAVAVTRVIKRVVEGDSNAVTSLGVNDAAAEISFSETTAPGDDKGFTFFVRPGEPVHFRLRIGSQEETLENITRDQLRLGATGQLLPADEDPGNFTLVSNLPVDPVGAPSFIPGAEVGTFIWQDIDNTTCNAATEDQWRVRFSTQGDATAFTGTVRGFDDEKGQAQLRVTPVGGCPAGPLDKGNRRLTYDCTLRGDATGGYDVCVSHGRRVAFNPQIDGVRDPALVFLGAARAAPPSPDPYAVLFDIELTERLASRNLRFSNASVFLQGNNNEVGAVQLNPDQVSLDPLCRGAETGVQPRVRLTGGGDYATERFEGSAYVLENVEFTEANVDSLADFRRFPDRGEVRLETRVEGENTDVTARMETIEEQDGRASVSVDVDMSVSGVLFHFPDQPVGLTVE
jgi:hypothetical protein